MGTIDLAELGAGNISLDASLIAHDLDLSPAQVLERLRDGRLTARCEQGIGEDAGRFRLSFFHDSRRLRLLIDQAGEILERSTVQLRRREGQPATPPSSPSSRGASPLVSGRD